MIHLKNITNVKPKCEPRKKNVKKDRKKKKNGKDRKNEKGEVITSVCAELHDCFTPPLFEQLTSAPALFNWRENTIVQIAPDSKFKINHLFGMLEPVLAIQPSQRCVHESRTRFLWRKGKA